MEKYSGFAKITDKYLRGNLEQLIIDYEDENHFTVEVVYEMNNYYSYDYKMEIDIDSKSVDFLAHNSKGSLNKVNLLQEKAFEKAISNYLFSK